MRAKTFGIAVAPAEVDLQISTNGPAQVLQTLHKRRGASLHLGVVGTRVGEYAHAPHALRLLGPRRERPRGRGAAEEHDEFAPPWLVSGLSPGLMLRSSAARPRHHLGTKSGALRCVSKHEAVAPRSNGCPPPSFET